jgi:hypothetical protein
MEHKDSVQAIMVFNDQLKVVTGHLNKIGFASCSGFYQEHFCVADNSICFRENQAKSFV